ncbi:MAG TPA: biotin carboxylase N-terminal domain-containing protein [Acidimicrobiales bacterium]|nr:biotin carboxylase N-terminal domain-containing protein [Acidimicrobiales bacterium]
MAAPVRPLRRVLVANRGEIARRLIRGVHGAGCEAVAVYAADDAAAPHVGEADAAVALPGSALADTYLDPVVLVQAAQLAGADALHPGYGFLSEDPTLAEACERAGIVWVGPPAEAMRAMGHKARAKARVAAAGVPVLPSAVVPVGATPDAVAAAGAAVGYPLLVKASAGGGGRGMRPVHEDGALADAVASARREAAASFGSEDIMLEPFLIAPRHVEVQVVADAHGTVLHLLDRECSVQRRHQKVVEEAPAVLVPARVRRAMWDAALAAAGAVDYVGVGTVEFLVVDESFWFLEMNTRLQVEHGVTELVSGLDLVGLQLGVAAGQPLPFGQADVVARGHAVEVRVCAERPREGFRPTPGTVVHVRWPEGVGLRTDAAVERGSVVSHAYDSLVAKLMAHGPDRVSAVGSLSRAVRGLELDGLETNRDLLAAVLDDEAFRAGQVDVHWLESREDLRHAGLDDDVRRRHAAAAAFSLLEERSACSVVPLDAAAWRNVGTALHADRLTDAVGTLEVRVASRGAPAFVRAVVVGQPGDHDGWEPVGTATATGGGVVDLAGVDGVRRRYRVRASAHRVEVNGPEGQSSFSLSSEDDPDEAAGVAGECRAPLPGSVSRVLVTVGDVVADGDALVVLEAMKMEHTLRADGAGTVAEVACAPGQQVDVNDLLIALEAP